MTLAPLLYEKLIHEALLEDLGQAGDLTTDNLFSPTDQTRVVLQSREPGVLAGLEPALSAFRRLDPQVSIQAFVSDGAPLAAGTLIAELRGSTQAILTAERTALNLLCHLSGIASRTRRFVDAIEGTSATIVDTRKTLPGLRALQKYAVRVGGGKNHRFGLADCALIKDNHIAACGSVTQAVERLRSRLGHTVKIEVEVDTKDQFLEALAVAPDIIMLDNFTPTALAECVQLRGDRPVLLETSGRVTEETILDLAKTGVDLISIGALTHSVKVLDIGLDTIEEIL